MTTSSATLVTYFDKILLWDEISRENSWDWKKSYSTKKHSVEITKKSFLNLNRIIRGVVGIGLLYFFYVPYSQTGFRPSILSNPQPIIDYENAIKGL